MAMKIAAPKYCERKSYESYKQELKAWRVITDLEKTKQGIAVALSLPEDDVIREKVFDELDIDELKAEDGLDKLIIFLDEHLGKDDLADSIEKYDDFEDYKRGKNDSISDYISKFDSKYQRIKKKKMTLPEEILAFKLLKCANITTAERKLVLTGMDYSDRATLYSQAKSSLKKFKGDQILGAEHSTGILDKNIGAISVKQEPCDTYVAENETVYASNHNFSRGSFNSRGSYRGRGGYRGRGYNGKYNQSFNASPSYPNKKNDRPVNPLGFDGKILTCAACGSYRHLMAKCPDSWENRGQSNQEIVHENVVLFTGYDKANMSELEYEARKCAVLDCACSSTVCGEKWLNDYIDSLNEYDRSKVIKHVGFKTFKFGGGEVLKSLSTCEIPAVLAGKNVTINTDVVKSDISLLLSIKSMKKAQIKLDLVNDMAEILGEKVNLNYTSSGHYCIPIDSYCKIPMESVCMVQLDKLSDHKRYVTLQKLHRQFAHPTPLKLKGLLKDANIWCEEYEQDLADIYKKCDICKMYSRTPPRPVVAMPMASRFNQKVAMDLKQWGNRWILHIIDMFSRFTVSIFVHRKKSCEIIDKIMTH